VGVLPDRFDSRAVLTLSGTEALIGGCKDGKLRLDDCSAAIYRLDGDVLRLVYERPGRVDGFARAGSVVFADVAIYLRQTNSNRHRLLRSIDAGKHFEEWKPMPMTGVAQLLATGPEEIWCLGAHSLSRTTDAGASWTDVAAPGERNSVNEKLAIAGGSVLVLGTPLLLTSDGGRTWSSIDTNGVRVTASNGELLAGARGGQVFLGRLIGNVVRWQHDLNAGSVLPLQLAVLGQGRVMMATTPPLDDPAASYASTPARMAAIGGTRSACKTSTRRSFSTWLAMVTLMQSTSLVTSCELLQSTGELRVVNGTDLDRVRSRIG
jgi:hypothetical protein